MAVDTGMRSQELFRLYDDEVDLVEGMVYLGNYNPNRTKTGANRSFPLSERATQALQSLRTHWMTHKGPQWSGFYFENPKTGKPITSVKTAWKGICRRAGITDLHFHDLRHTFATWGLAAGSMKRPSCRSLVTNIRRRSNGTLMLPSSLKHRLCES